ncbi:MAG: AAA family ATPase, partial [Chloroflexota bacterium]
MAKAQLRHLLNEYFSEGELRELCFDLDVPYDDLSGRGKREKVMELIGYLERRNRLADLLELGRRLRPNVNWPSAAAISQPEYEDIRIEAQRETGQLQNPFTYGNPISDPERFFGRQREIEQVFSRLTNAEHESSSLVGSRRIGKTSLLKHIAHPNVRRRFGLDSQHYIFLFVDLQMLDQNTTPVRLWQRLLGKMAPHCRDAQVSHLISELRAVEEIDNFALADLFDAIDAAGQHLVLLLDEFENVTKNENFDVDFFYGLRSLAIQHNLSLVTSSSQELIELTHSEAIRSSPFFNIFANINVGLFSEEESRQLIETYLADTEIQFNSSCID